MEVMQSVFMLGSFKWRVTVSGELMFLDSYDNCDVTNAVTLLYDVTKHFFITFLTNTVTLLLLIFRRVSR